MTDSQKAPGIQILQVILERSSFAHRADYLSLPPSTALEVGLVSVDVQIALNPDQQGAVIRMRAYSKPEDRPLYELDVTMAAIVRVDPTAPNMPIGDYASSAGPAMLFMFIRQYVADLTMRGRFGAAWLNPMNFVPMQAQLRKQLEAVAPLGAPTPAGG